MSKPVYSAKIRGEIDSDGDVVYVGETTVTSLVPDHFTNHICEVIVNIYKKEEVKK